jgi:hypothetical protein
VSRRKNQAAKQAAGRRADEQYRISLYGEDYNEQTKEVYWLAVHWSAMTSTLDNLEKFPDENFRAYSRWNTKDELRSDYAQRKEDLADTIRLALETGDASFFRTFATALEANSERCSAVDTYRHMIILMLFKWPHRDHIQIVIPTARHLQKMLEQVGINVAVEQLRRDCKAMGVKLAEAKPGRPQDLQKKTKTILQA